MGMTASCSFDYYKGKLDAEYYGLLGLIEHIEYSLELAENSLELTTNEFEWQQFSRFSYEFINKLRAIKERVDSFDKSTWIPNKLTYDHNDGFLDGKRDAKACEFNHFGVIERCESDEYFDGYANAYAFNKTMNDHRSEFVDGVIPYDKFYPWFKDELDKANAYLAEKRSNWEAHEASKQESNS